jgi:hypothetical protein
LARRRIIRFEVVAGNLDKLAGLGRGKIGKGEDEAEMFEAEGMIGGDGGGILAAGERLRHDSAVGGH